MPTFTFPGVAEGDNDSGYSLFFPDLPGCVTAGETLSELAVNAREALALHLEGMAEDGEIIPEATPLEALPHDPDVKSAGVVLVDAPVSEPRIRLNITFSKPLLARVDQAAKSVGVDRSAFLEQAARRMLENNRRRA
ncbi:MAG: type II toxin-antitoxin system HicB family antitoxin [Caulobacteraceae bacterium]